MITGYATQEYLEEDYPNRSWVLIDTVEEAVAQVAEGRIDAFVGDMISISYATQKLGLKNLKVAATTPYKLRFAFAVRPDWPELIPPLNRALGAITEAEKTEIVNRWVNVRFERTMDWRLVGGIVGAVFVVVAAILTVIVIWNRKLAREAVLRREAEERTRLTLDSAGDGIIGVDQRGPGDLRQQRRRAHARFRRRRAHRQTHPRPHPSQPRRRQPLPGRGLPHAGGLHRRRGPPRGR